METRELRYFVAVAEELHFARAAARVGIEQSPLSKAIAALEHRLGVQLFIRTRRSTTLTTVGERLLHDARRILAEVDCAQRNIKAAAAGRSGRLRISVCDGVAHPRLARLLAQSREEDPGVDIQVINSPFSEQLRGLRSGAFDLAFGLQSSSDREVHSHPVWKDRAAIVVRSDRMESHVGSLLLLGEDSSVGSEPVEAWLRSSADRRARLAIEAESVEGGNSVLRIEHVSSTELLLTLVAAGYGIGIISAAQGETIHRPDLVLHPVAADAPRIETFLSQRSEGPSRLVLRFRERVLKMAAEGDS